VKKGTTGSNKTLLLVSENGYGGGGGESEKLRRGDGKGITEDRGKLLVCAVTRNLKKLVKQGNASQAFADNGWRKKEEGVKHKGETVGSIG